MAKGGGFDKEALKKHQFWIVLGVFALLWVVAFVMVKATASVAKKNAYDAAKKAIEDAQTQGPKTEAYQKPWNEHGTKFRTHKDVIWGQAWQKQESMYNWPNTMLKNGVHPRYIEDHFGPPGDTSTDLKMRAAFRTDWYQELFDGLENYVAPAEFAGGSIYDVFPVQHWDPSQPPTREEIWLAMEDYWVRREMLAMIHEAMDAVATFKEVLPNGGKDAGKEKEKAKPKPADPSVPVKRVFRNANWEITLLLEPREKGGRLAISEKSTIKNINAAERTMMLAHPKTNLGLPFQVEQGRAVLPFFITGEPIAFGAQVEFKQKVNPGAVDLSKPFELKQVLLWELSPVRRIDQLMLAYHSHRTATAGLKVNEELKKLDPEPEAPAGDATGSSTIAPGAPGGPGGKGGMGMGEGGPGGAGAGGGGSDVTRVNGIPRDRYMYITPQCRHLPIALKLLIDQAHIHDVLAAIASSRLRIQVTQVSLNHDPTSGTPQGGMGGFGGPPAVGGGGPSAGMGGPGAGGMGARGGPPMPGMGSGARPPGSGMGGARGGPPMPGMGSGARPPGSGMGGLAGMPGRPFLPGAGGRGMGTGREGEGEGNIGMGPGPGGLPGSTEGVSTFQDTAKLVELSVYGIASLYERFPPRPKTGDTPAPTTGTGTTTGAEATK